MKAKTQKELGWKIHTANLFDEILNKNNKMGIFNIPLNILGKLLAEVGERASELNDPILNELMCRLTIYTIADPESPDYDPKKLKEISSLAEKTSA
ncbi:MAG TPA: hypothetical protein VF599_12650 [Pyrinomonadaceae bacterium]|jgi:hypothetical protein